VMLYDMKSVLCGNIPCYIDLTDLTVIGCLASIISFYYFSCQCRNILSLKYTFVYIRILIYSVVTPGGDRLAGRAGPLGGQYGVLLLAVVLPLNS
jgi:hypothetical protein